MDATVRSLHPTRVGVVPSTANTHLWVRAHAYLGPTIPLAALLRAPWLHLRQGDNDSHEGQGTGPPLSNVLPFRRRHRDQP